MSVPTINAKFVDLSINNSRKYENGKNNLETGQPALSLAGSDG